MKRMVAFYFWEVGGGGHLRCSLVSFYAGSLFRRPNRMCQPVALEVAEKGRPTCARAASDTIKVSFWPYL